MTALIVSSSLIAWDWLLVLLGLRDVVLLGITHLLWDVWAIALAALGLKGLLEVPIWLCVVLLLLSLLLAVPLAMVFMRGPV